MGITGAVVLEKSCDTSMNIGILSPAHIISGNSMWTSKCDVGTCMAIACPPMVCSWLWKLGSRRWLERESGQLMGDRIG